MTFSEILLIAIGLAMDCFAISVISAYIMGRLQFFPMLRIALLFGLFQAIMPYISWSVGIHFQKYFFEYAQWIAFFILIFLGIRMIIEDRKSRRKKECKHLFNPYKPIIILSLAVATSIDAFAVGISFAAFPGLRLFPAVSLIGTVSFLISWAGMGLSLIFREKFHFRAYLIGGTILIAIGIKILLEH